MTRVVNLKDLTPLTCDIRQPPLGIILLPGFNYLNPLIYAICNKAPIVCRKCNSFKLLKRHVT